MKAGIISAGMGERLSRGGIAIPKPLLPINGKPLIARILEAAARLDISSVACIVNNLYPTVADYLRSHPWPLPLELIVQTTPSSMESLFALEPFLRDEPFLLFTVDVVFSFAALERFAERAQSMKGAEGVLALTEFVDDEKPLWVSVDDDFRITAMGNDAEGGRYITAGFYAFAPKVFDFIDEARNLRLNALRQFLNLLVRSGYELFGFPVDKTVDVDYPEDIAKAERYLAELGEP